MYIISEYMLLHSLSGFCTCICNVLFKGILPYTYKATFIICLAFIYLDNSCVSFCISLSAGVGRTGTLITIDRVLDQIREEMVVDIAGTITQLRKQRMKMVQTLVCVCVCVCVYVCVCVVGGL